MHGKLPKNETASLLLYLSNQQVSLDFMMVHISDSGVQSCPGGMLVAKLLSCFHSMGTKSICAEDVLIGWDMLHSVHINFGQWTSNYGQQVCAQLRAHIECDVWSCHPMTLTVDTVH